MNLSDALANAENCVKRSEQFQGTGSELRNIREALRCLITAATLQQAVVNQLLPQDWHEKIGDDASA